MMLGRPLRVVRFEKAVVEGGACLRRERQIEGGWQAVVVYGNAEVKVNFLGTKALVQGRETALTDKVEAWLRATGIKPIRNTHF